MNGHTEDGMGSSGPAPLVVALSDAARYGPAVVGAKAHTLARLAAVGFPVPDGVVVTPAAQAAWDHALPLISDAVKALGAERVAVRSSGAAEDLADASFAGLYDTVLDVALEHVPSAVRQVFDSATGPRVRSYQQSSGEQAVMAVLVQRMVDADVAGVAFTANPLTGQRDEAVVTAVRGLGESLVSGAAEGDEWIVRDGRAVRGRSVDDVLAAPQAVAVAQMARRVAERLGCPQDIEWAIAGGTLYLLQARPITALVDAVAWNPPGPGRWMRNFRIGEWLPDPMTPLFATWLLPQIEHGMDDTMRAAAGAVPSFRSAAVHGWYYTALPQRPLRSMAGAFAAGRGRMLAFVFNALIRINRRPDAADRALLGGLVREWRDDHLPRYRRLVADAEARADRAGPAELEHLVDRLGLEAGAQLAWLELLGGSAWKMEACLARFTDRHLAGTLDDGVAVLLRGLQPMRGTPGHAVQSLDWYHATAGDLPTASAASAQPPRAGVVDARARAERACGAALAGRPRERARFEALLEVAQRYATLREEQAHDLTLAWPVLRRCVLRLGEHLAGRDVIADAGDVFFLERGEIDAVADRRDEVEARRAAWRRRRRLIAPLTLGVPHRLLPDVTAGAVAAIRRPAVAGEHAIVGHPASPGRATGAVRVLHGPEDFARLAPGEVLVARITAPAWTPLFSKAAAVVTDGGSLVAHASLIAREYGIPAVVATGDATVRLRDGQIVTVDGGTGIVET